MERMAKGAEKMGAVIPQTCHTEKVEGTKKKRKENEKTGMERIHKRVTGTKVM